MIKRTTKRMVKKTIKRTTKRMQKKIHNKLLKNFQRDRSHLNIIDLGDLLIRMGLKMVYHIEIDLHMMMDHQGHIVIGHQECMVVVLLMIDQDMHQDYLAIDQDPMVIDQDPLVIDQGHMVIDRDYMVIDQDHMVIGHLDLMAREVVMIEIDPIDLIGHP